MDSMNYCLYYQGIIPTLVPINYNGAMMISCSSTPLQVFMMTSRC